MVQQNASTLWLPTQEACSAYGIPRTNTVKRSDQTFKFLSGPQFSDIRITSSNSTDNGEPNTPRIDEVVIEFIGNQPYQLDFKPDGSSGSQIMKAVFNDREKDDEPILTMRIAPNTTDWINFSAKHSWEKPGGIIASLFESVMGLVNEANSFITDVSNVSSNVSKGAGNGTLPKQKIQMDMADAYQKTDQVEITVPFLLWSAGSTVEDWVRDVYFPIMMLMAMSHPRRSRKLNSEEIIKGLIASEQKKNAESGKKEDDKTIAERVQGMVNKLYPGAKMVIIDPPSFIRIRHSSGLFMFNRCAISSFSFKYLDPWVKAVVNEGLNGDETLLKQSLPMRAECSLTLRSIEAQYADDWISMYESGLEALGGGSGSKVTVSIRQSSNTQRSQAPTNSNTGGAQ